MAHSIADLEAMLDELVRHRARGVKAAQLSSGERVDYKSDAEMAAAIADLEARIRRASTPPPGFVRFKTSKGF